MIFDWDDFADDDASSHAFHLLYRLKDVNPDFRCTLFTIPGRCSPLMFSLIPPWMEIAVHGWSHPDPHECQAWGVARMRTLMDEPIVKEHFVRGFKAPGWQISEGCYAGLLERGWWVADQPYNNHRRPEGLRCHLLGAPNSYHGHVQNVCGNGLPECFAEVEALVRAADSFQFVSEVVK